MDNSKAGEMSHFTFDQLSQSGVASNPYAHDALVPQDQSRSASTPLSYRQSLEAPNLQLKGALRLHFRRRVFDGKTKVGEREDPSNKNESPEAIESSGKTTFEFRRASADDVMRD